MMSKAGKELSCGKGKCKGTEAGRLAEKGARREKQRMSVWERREGLELGANRIWMGGRDSLWELLDPGSSGHD